MPAVPESVDSIRKRVREAVLLFEHKEGSRLVDIKEIPGLVRKLVVNPSGAQLTQVVDQLAAMNADSDHSTLLNIEQLETVITNFLVQQAPSLVREDYHLLTRAFRAFDPEGKGWLDAEHLKLLLTARGEAMTEEEVNKMITFAADQQGRVYYEDYAQKLALDGRAI